MCRLHLLNKHLNGPASLEDAFKESFILCPLLFSFLFCLRTEPFYHLQHKKLDKMRNFWAGSRAVRFVCREMCVCAQGREFAVATSRPCVLQGRERRGAERWRAYTFAVEPLQQTRP